MAGAPWNPGRLEPPPLRAVTLCVLFSPVGSLGYHERAGTRLAASLFFLQYSAVVSCPVGSPPTHTPPTAFVLRSTAVVWYGSCCNALFVPCRALSCRFVSCCLRLSPAPTLRSRAQAACRAFGSKQGEPGGAEQTLWPSWFSFRHGLAWPGLAWPGLAWHGLAWHGMTRHHVA